uniref:Uncharacterized protein n=1 Tax=Romanomermis culicivorax TaxID=13658 RepID=A0A915JP86_ROMCU
MIMNNLSPVDVSRSEVPRKASIINLIASSLLIFKFFTSLLQPPGFVRIRIETLTAAAAALDFFQNVDVAAFFVAAE